MKHIQPNERESKYESPLSDEAIKLSRLIFSIGIIAIIGSVVSLDYENSSFFGIKLKSAVDASLTIDDISKGILGLALAYTLVRFIICIVHEKTRFVASQFDNSYAPDAAPLSARLMLQEEIKAIQSFSYEREMDLNQARVILVSAQSQVTLAIFNFEMRVVSYLERNVLFHNESELERQLSDTRLSLAELSSFVDKLVNDVSDTEHQLSYLKHLDDLIERADNLTRAIDTENKKIRRFYFLILSHAKLSDLAYHIRNKIIEIAVPILTAVAGLKETLPDALMVAKLLVTSIIS